MAEVQYIAIDLGAESGRVMLGSVSRDRIALREIHRFPNTPITSAAGALHWDIEALWREIKSGIAKAADVAGDNVSGIGVDTWGVDFALLDGDLQLLDNPVCYRDPRTAGMPEAIFAKISREKIYSITGIQTLPINTIFHLAALSFGRSPQLAAARHIVFLPDLLTFWLSGKLATEYTIASTSQMLDARTRQFSPEILHALNLDAGVFPSIGMPPRQRGPVLAAVHEKLAAAKTPVIAVASHDTASAVAAVPGTDAADWLYLSSGTWSLLGAEVEAPVLTEKAAAFNITNEGGLGGRIRLLKNIPGLWLLQECRRAWAEGGQSFEYAELTRLAETASAQGALLDLSDPAFAAPGNMPQKIVDHCRRTRQTAPATPGQFARLIFESLAARYAEVVGQLETVTSRKFKTLHIVGGGSRNELLNQLAADATRLPVFAGPVEATALGNVLAQALSTGALADLPAARRLVARSFPPEKFVPRE